MISWFDMEASMFLFGLGDEFWCKKEVISRLSEC